MTSTGKVKIVGAVLVALVILVGGVLLYLFVGGRGAMYYTQIDNSHIEQNQSRGGVIDLKGNMKYSYTLTCYNERGKAEEITFGTDRQLREGAFLRLEVVPLRGVVDWAELPYDELPTPVREMYPRGE